MKPVKSLLAAFLLAAFGAGAANASTLIGAPGTFGDGTPIPFGTDAIQHFQQLYDQSLFSNPLTIGGLTFFTRNSLDNPGNGGSLSGTIHDATYTIALGTFQHGAFFGGNLNDNLLNVSDLTTFFSGELSGPATDHFTIASNQQPFVYDNSAGDLLLDITLTLTNPELTVGVDYNNDVGNGLSLAYENVPGDISFGDCSTIVCAIADFGLVTEFEGPGETQGNPLLPAIDGSGNFIFTDQPSGSWFDPAAALGFHYLASPGTLFTHIMFPAGFASSFNLLDGSNNLLGTFNGGDAYDFASPVSEFSITGIAPPVDPSNPAAFPLFIQFDNPIGSFQMDPLFSVPSTGGVPEPASFALLGGGLAAIGLALRRARRG